MNTRPSSSLVLRISLVVAIAAGLGVGALNYFRVKQRINGLRAELAAQTTIAQRAEGELARTQQELEKTAVSLKVTKTELEQTVAEKQAAVATAAEQTSMARKRGEDLAGTRQDLEDAQRYLARYRATGLEPEQIAGAATEIRNLKKDAEASKKKYALLEQRTRMLTSLQPDKEAPIPLPAGLHGTVLTTDLKWRFLVLDIGADEGVLQNGELLVRRGDKLVGKAKVSRVEKDRCVANLLAGWDVGEIKAGDVAIPATPQS
jgi:hypothetical protein